MAYVVDTRSLSETEIREDLLTFIQGQSDGAKWLDFFNGSHGSTIIELCAGIGAMLNYQASANRKETNILTAKLKSSLYAMAYTLGYPINRKLSAKVQLIVNNKSKPIFWQRDIPVGFFNGSPISLLKSATIPSGVSTIDCVVGSWKTNVHRVTEYQDYYILKLPIDTDIDFIDNELVEVLINNERIDLTRYIEDMDETKLVILTQINHIVLMFGSKVMGRPVKINDLIQIDYLELKPTTVSDQALAYNISNLQIDQQLECSKVTLVRREQPEDDLQKIARIIPGYFSSKRRMVTPDDHEAIVNSYSGVRHAKFASGICSVDPLNNYNQATCIVNSGTWTKANSACCTQVMSYLQYSEQEWLESEEDLVYKYLEQFQIAGENIIFRKGEPVLVNLTATIVLYPNANVENVKEQLNKVLEAQCYKLGSTFNIARLTHDINKIKGVYQCYIQRPFKDRRLAFYGYFKPGEINVTYTTQVDLASDFKDITGGYNPEIGG